MFVQLPTGNSPTLEIMYISSTGDILVPYINQGFAFSLEVLWKYVREDWNSNWSRGNYASCSRSIWILWTRQFGPVYLFRLKENTKILLVQSIGWNQKWHFIERKQQSQVIISREPISAFTEFWIVSEESWG